MRRTATCSVSLTLLLATACAEAPVRIVADTFCLRAERIDVRPLAAPGTTVEVAPSGWAMVNAITRPLAEQIAAHNRKVADCGERDEERGR